MAYRRSFYPRYVSVAERKAKAEKKRKQLRKKYPDIRPVILGGTALAKTWWGKAWNKNLEGYADYSNRIGRGRAYVRHGAVVDLKIEPGLVTAQVLGSHAHPYRTAIRIKPLSPARNRGITKKCQAELTSLADLLAGKFPKSLQEIFMVRGTGLFPTPAEISFDCSCPDWASMCKHVAAALYGVGARLDEDPALFFTLRGIDMEELVGRAARDRADAVINQDHKTATGTISDDKLGELFGLELDDFKVAPPAINERKEDASAHLPDGYGSAPDLILGCLVEIVPDTLSAQELSDITGIPRRKIYPLLQRLKREKLADNPARGRWTATVQEE